MHGPGLDADQDQQARQIHQQRHSMHNDVRRAVSSNFSSAMTAATARIPAGGECGKPGSPVYHGHGNIVRRPAGNNFSSVMTAATATIPAGG